VVHEVVSIEEVCLGLLVRTGTYGREITWNYDSRYFVVEPVVRCDILAIRYLRQIDWFQAQIRAAKLHNKVSKRIFLKVRFYRLPGLREQWSSSAAASPSPWSKATPAAV
jgi:hypothetical protein